MPLGVHGTVQGGFRLHEFHEDVQRLRTIQVTPEPRRRVGGADERKTVGEICRELQVSENSFNRWQEQALEASTDDARHGRPVEARHRSRTAVR